MESIPPEALLADYPDHIREGAETLRAIVRRTIPDALERVRGGWRLIGYEVPIGRRSRYFAYIAPEPIHLHLGFEYGAWMADPDSRLEGAHLKLRKVRFLTFQPGQPIPEGTCSSLLREAARVAAMSRDERLALTLDGEWSPEVGNRPD
jgi:hypothetical protein